MKNSNVTVDLFSERTHTIGRLFIVGALLLMLALPASLCLYFNVWPPAAGMLKSLVSVLMVYIPVSVVEVASYAPMVGAGGSYLGFVTGNLSNLKIPCAANARVLANAEIGSKESELVSTISIAVSSIVTTLILFVSLLLMAYVEPLLTDPVLKPAFDNVLPALFGALGYTLLKKDFKLAIFPCLALLPITFFLAGNVSGLVSYLVPIGVVLAIIGNRILYKKGILK